MRIVSLNELSLKYRHHRSAMWWLGLLYRQPDRFERALGVMGYGQSFATACRLFIHQTPYMLITCCISRWAIFELLDVASLLSRPSNVMGTLQFHVTSLLTGVSVGLVIGIGGALAVGIALVKAYGVTYGVSSGFAIGIAGTVCFCTAFGSAVGIASTGITSGVAGGLVTGFALGTTGSIAYHLARQLSGGVMFALTLGGLSGLGAGATIGIAAGIAFGPTAGIVQAFGAGASIAITVTAIVALAGSMNLGAMKGVLTGLLFGLVFGLAASLVGGAGEREFSIANGLTLGLTVFFFFVRAYYLPLQPFFILSRRRAGYTRHPVTWDDLCLLPFAGLHQILTDYGEEQPRKARAEVNRLIDIYPSQRRQALYAQAALLARQARDTKNLSHLNEIIARLPEGKRGFLSQTRRLRKMAHEIALIQARIETIDRQILREPLARLLVREIETFRAQVSGLHQPLSREFRAAATSWLEFARRQLVDAQAVLAKEPTKQVFRAGDPVDRNNEAFVPRDAVTGEIERQVMLATGCPGLVLYGRRRTGKSTILHNLVGFLPPSVRRAGISMQDPAAFTNLESLIEELAAQIRHGALLENTLETNNLLGLFKLLDQANGRLAKQNRRLLLSIDEYENIDHKIGEGGFPEELLATVRESIQIHRQITWIFAGSHEITELPHVDWSSYLISARTVEVGPFTPAETRLLLTEPLKHSNLWPKDDPARPHFDLGFWGEGGVARIHAEANGWPHLVQLIAETIVDLLNDDQRAQVDAEIFERALDKAIVSGHTVFHQLVRGRGETTLHGEWEYLSAFRSRKTQPPPASEAVARSLLRRRLVTEDGDKWRLQVPLMERWLRQRG